MEITNISNIDSTQYLNQDYTPKDESLLNSLLLNKDFGLPEDKIEVHVISPTEGIIDSTYDFRNYKIVDTTDNSSLYHTIELDPKSDLESFGYFRGQYDISYNFYREIFSSSLANQFFISEISSDRTEIKISSNNISYTDLGQSYLNYIAERNSRAFYSDFLLNFGENDTYIGVNIAFDNVNTSVSSLYIKLYEPLPSKLSLKDTLWLVEQISEQYSFQVNTEFVAEEISDSTPLRGPNISIELNEKTNLTTPLLNLSTLLNTSVTSSYQQLQSWLEENNVEITVDYTDFSNFVHFSSATERLENFKYKLSQIQSLQADIDSLNSLNISSSINYTTTSKSSLQSRIDTIIQKFDGYEYFLYYESGSNSWPKSNSSKPYINYNTTSSQAKTWFGSTLESSIYYGGQILDAVNYDNDNKDYVWNNLPEYIKEDTQNSNLELFVAMLGQHYDYIWTYVRDITDLQVADNRVDFGISKDLVADTLRNFGMKLYTNSRNQDDIFSSLLGVNSAGGFLPSTGSLLITNYITASQYTIPDNDIVKETYKRIYHNLPYLLKTKGTRRGLYSLINCFGIPETILKVKEYGGNKKDQDIIEQFNEKFNYSLNLSQSSTLQIPWFPSYKQYKDSGSLIIPDTLEFRFKLDSNNIQYNCNILEDISNNTDVSLIYTTGLNAQMNLNFYNNYGSSGNLSSPSIELPFYNGDWWTLNLTRVTGSLTTSQINLSNTYTLTVGNKDSNGIQYLVSSSIYNTGSEKSLFNQYNWNDINYFFPGGANIIRDPMIGSIQEFRYWIGSIPTDDFKDHILNPQSIEYNGVTGSYNNLIFRLPLGSELDNTKVSSLSSVHPSPTASFINSSITSSNAVLNNYLNSTYDINYETYLVNTPNVGSITEIDEKVRIADPNLIPGDVLTPYISIQKPETFPYTTDLNIVEVAISPQDSINEDIISQLGSFNIDEYIGNPRLTTSDSYPALTELRNFYFQKYSKKENIFDIIKLLSYFDNSLFKMIKDFVPAKANLSTGLIIKPHILERNKIARHEPVLEFNQYSGSIETAFISGSNGLDEVLNTDFTSFIPFTGDPYEYSAGDYFWTAISQNLLNPYGGTYKSNTDKRELFTGELGGTVITVHSQSQENVIYELNNLPVSSSQAINDNYYRLPINPILNNVSLQQNSSKYLDIDYGTNNIIPTNNNFLSSQLLLNINSFNYPFLSSTVQNSNYTLHRHITPRYNGSKLTGALYNTYSIGDDSYGKDPVIDINSVKFAYFSEITSQSLTFPGRSNANLKYLIDSASNVTELTEANKNLFDVQDIFNRTDANIALENINQPSKQKSLNGLKPIYAGGFKYEPILQNLTEPGIPYLNNLQFSLLNDVEVDNPSNFDVTVNLQPDGFEITSPGLYMKAPTFGRRRSRTLGLVLGAELDTTVPTGPITSYEMELNSGIYVNVKRTTAINKELRQKITGSIQLVIKFSPPDNKAPVIIYTGLNQTGTAYKAYDLGKFSGWVPLDWDPTPDKVQDIIDNMRSIRIPAGKNVFAWGNGEQGSTNSFTGPGDYSNEVPFNTTNRYGFDGMEVTAADSFVRPNTTNFQTTFIGANFNYSQSYNNGQSYQIKEDNDIIFITTFNFIAEIVLPAYSGQTPTPILLKTLEGANTNIVYKTSYSSPSPTTSFFRILEKPTLDSPLITAPPLSQYYYDSPPGKLYVSSLSDNGYNSGSAAIDNWYFERGSSGDGIFNQLTASYDLSNFFYKLNVEQQGYYSENNITQILPTQSLELGYQDITEPFNPKVGDLIRLYNHDSETFPYSPSFEREIIKIIEPQSNDIGSGSNGVGGYQNRLVFELNSSNISSQNCNNAPSGSDIGQILNFIILTKTPDETNVIINHEKRPGSSSAGILLPTNISPEIKKEAGNIIKNLKSQNLI